MKWSRASVLPRVFAAPAAMQMALRVSEQDAIASRVPRPKRGGLLSSSRASRFVSCEIGGLCGHCSRDLPLDRRLLFVAELTGQDGGLCR